MPQHLLTRGAVDTQLRDGSVPVLEMFGECGQAVEAVALQRVGFDVAAAAFSDAVLLRMTWPRRQRDESPMRGKRRVHLADVRVVQASTHDGGFQIVVSNDARHAAQPDKGMLVCAQKAVALLCPQRLFIAML